jgi:hypothetical protein
MSYKKPEVTFLNVREEALMSSGKRECDERGCCVKSLKNY